MAHDLLCTPLDGVVEPATDVHRVRRAAFDALRTGRAPRLGEIADVLLCLTARVE
jgi:hypothetical protein